MPLFAPRVHRIAFVALVMMAFPFLASAQERPIPVGLDAYRQWDQWPAQRIGMRATMRSTYDRGGGNNGVDASHFLFQLSDTSNVTLDLEGPGVLMFSRFNHWHGSPWQFVVDGTMNVVQESATADPAHRPAVSEFIPAAPFPRLLNETWQASKGADLMWSPMEFENSFQMAYSRTKYGTGYYIYDQFVPGTPLSHPLKAWDETTVPSKDVVDLVGRAGTDIAPRTGTTEKTGVVSIAASGAAMVANLTGKSSIRVLTFSIPDSEAMAFEHVQLHITWDGRAQPSVDSPIALFYGAGSLLNRDSREYLVKSFPMSIRFANGRIELACYLPMPYFKSARIELASAGAAVKDVRWTIRTLPFTGPANRSAYFHATYRDFPTPTPGVDLTLLDTKTVEGSTDWSGSFVGTSIIFSHNGKLTTLEGDPRFFFDDSLTPQAQGTGTEEWGGGGDYWENGKQTTLAFVGHPVGVPQGVKPIDDEDKVESMYRFLLGDLFPFGKNALIHVEHGGTDESVEHYETVAYWYGLPSASLVQTDVMQLGDLKDEAAHGYVSLEASAPTTFSSRYEWGVDTFKGKEIFPASSDTGRTTTGTSEFVMKVRKDNLGVMLRRKLDYSYPDQRAEVSVQMPGGAWKIAGTWYLAGSNTVVYSNPKEELGAAEHNIQTSNRRFRDDEFLVPRDLTRGQTSLRVRVRFKPLNRPLFPGHPVSPQAWSEIKYTAYSFVEPSKP